MKEFTHTITDPNGIHARPAGLLAQAMQNCRCEVYVKKEDGTRANAKQLIALMKLRLKCGQTFTLVADGEDEDTAIESAQNILTVSL